jgi:hypothetical protein
VAVDQPIAVRNPDQTEVEQGMQAKAEEFKARGGGLYHKVCVMEAVQDSNSLSCTAVAGLCSGDTGGQPLHICRIEKRSAD